jgi:hypothetical protein
MQASLKLGTGAEPSPEAQLEGYRAAQWTAFAFAMCGALLTMGIRSSVYD